MADPSKTRLVNEFPTRLSFLTTRAANLPELNAVPAVPGELGCFYHCDMP